MRFLLWMVVLLFSCSCTRGQVTFRVTDLPEGTPEDAKVYLAGNFNNWNPGNEDYVLERDGSDLVITINPESGNLLYKFTLGSWESVEGNSQGYDIANRSTVYNGTPITVDIKIATWRGAAGNMSTAADNVDVIDDFYMPQLDRNRRIWVYLPPDYENTAESYPVLYMHDGQNLFDKATSFSGEWEVDETLNNYHNQYGKGIIVVGVDNGGSKRIDEYSPWKNNQYGGGEGDAYMRFIKESLKPYVDSVYRTKSEKEHTGIMGSSLGGLISFYAGMEYSDVFGRVGVFSPSFWFHSKVYDLVYPEAVDSTSRYYMIGGEKEGGSMVQNIGKMNTKMENAGYKDQAVNINIHSDGEHSEWYWKREFMDAVEWLFFQETSRSEEVSMESIHVYPNPTTGIVHIDLDDQKSWTARVMTIEGKLISVSNFNSPDSLDLTHLKDGSYILELLHEKEPLKRIVLIKRK